MRKSYFKYLLLFIIMIFGIHLGFADKEKKQMVTQKKQQLDKNKKHGHSTVIYVPYIYYYPYYINSNPVPINNYQTNYYNSSPQPNFSYPKGEWIATGNGLFPEYAIVYRDSSQQRIFYCRVEYKNQIIYGFLVESEGCYINDMNGNKLRFDEYEVLKESD